MRLHALAFFLAVLAPAAAASAQDAAPPYQAAVAARMAGDPARAVALLDPWVAAHPEDVDARVQLGYALLALGKLDRADAQFTAVLVQAPDYSDARDGLAAIRQRRGQGETARGFVALEGALSLVGGGQSDWHELGATVSVPLGAATMLETRGTWYERFGLDDVEGSALVTHRASENTWLRFGLSGTPSADFRPRVAATAGVDVRAIGGADATVLGLDAAWQEFPLQTVVRVSPSATKYFGQGRFALTARGDAILADGRALVGGSLRGTYFGDEGVRLNLGAARGPDTDLGVVTQITSIFAGGEMPLTDRLSLTGAASREWRDGPADRTEFRLGLKLGW